MVLVRATALNPRSYIAARRQDACALFEIAISAGVLSWKSVTYTISHKIMIS